MFNVCSNNQQVLITLATSGTSVAVNGSIERSGTANDCIQYIRSLVSNYSYWMEKDKKIVFTVTSRDSSPAIAAEKRELASQLRRLASSCKCQVVVNTGLNFMG